MTPATRHPLDRTVRAVERALQERRFPAPDALLFLATGTGQLPDALAAQREVPLVELGVPEPFADATLFAGRLGGLTAWVLEDRSGDPLEGADQDGGTGLEPGWARSLPVWLAARAGAGLLVHASAGSALVADGTPRAPIGGIGLVRDHLNLSGVTPLIGLGASRLGPLFPDVSTLHHLGLRRRALTQGESMGLAVAEVVAACTPGPSLETAAERRMLARLGADVAVQSLQWPLLAAAHAGLSVLALVSVSDADGDAASVASLVEAAREQAPRLEQFVLALAEDLERAARTLREGQR